MAEKERTCQFYLVRYVPNPVRGEFVNIGVLLHEPAQNRLWPLRGLESFRRVRRLHPGADLELLAGWERQIEAEAASGGDLDGMLERWSQFSSSLELTPPRAVLTADPEAELERLYETYVLEPRLPTQLRAAVERSRAWLRRRLYDALGRAGLRERLESRVPVAEFTHSGDPFRFDFGYRRNGERGFLQTLVLEREVDRAKVLAYTMERIRARLGSPPHTVRCAAIVEALPEPENEVAQLSARILREPDITLVPAAELDGFVRELGRELG